MTRPFFLPALGIVNALGCGADAVARGLFCGDTSGMVLVDGLLPGVPARVGAVRDELPEVPVALADYACRSSRLLLAALAQIRADVDAALARFGRRRVGIVIGTSTSGIAEGEAAVAAHRADGRLPAAYRYVQQELGSPALFLARVLGVDGPAYCVSTACTSSAKALACARRLLQQGLCDAVVVGGVDTLCKLTLNGFAALDSMARELCNPMSRNRNGINIGEGAALFLMSRDESAFALLGVGESSDAYHMSAPHPQGVGAQSAMRSALADAALPVSAVDYLNLHATATAKNDAMESLAISRVFGDGVAASGTKPLTGHTLGSAGATELGLCWLALRAGLLPPHRWDGQADEALPRLDLVAVGDRFGRRSGRVCMSNSFAFGGSNASLLIGDAP